MRLIASLIFLASGLWFSTSLATSYAGQQPGDATGYSRLAVNLLQRGVFSNADKEPFTPSIMRLPGYPIVLAGVFSVYGVDNTKAVEAVQAVSLWLAAIIFGLIAAAWTADRKRKWRAFAAGYLLSVFCPFTAIYAALLLTESLAIFFLAASVLTATWAFKRRRLISKLLWMLLSGLSCGICVTLRPDAGLFAMAIGITLLASVFVKPGRFAARSKKVVLAGVIFSASFALPLIPWTVRNERVFGVFQPLAPAHAEEPGEFVPHGYYLWLRSWIDDPKYIAPMLWNLNEKPIEMKEIPETAFSSDDEKQRISDLIAAYNNSDPDHPYPPKETANTANESDSPEDSDDNSGDGDKGDGDTDQNTDGDSEENDEWDLSISPKVDERFRQIAETRIAAAPGRYYVVLPAKRAAAMWFDTHSDYYPFAGQLFPLSDLDESTRQQIWLPIFAGLVWAYTLLAAVGVAFLTISRHRYSKLWLLMFLLLTLPRVVFFSTLENPEPRYLIEFFPLIAVFGGVLAASFRFRRSSGSIGADIVFGNDNGVEDEK